MAIRQHRVDAFAKWLATAPPPFYQQPEFCFFKDLTPDEFSAASEIMEQESVRLAAEAKDLRTVVSNREGL